MNDNVVSLSRVKRLKAQHAFEDWAKEFVDVYVNVSEEAAAIWATIHIPEELYEEAAPYIRAEFESRGWTFDGPEVA